MNDLVAQNGAAILEIGIALLVILGVSFAFFPPYNVWAAHKEGLADLAKAQNEQQVQVAKANGRLQAADLNKKAAIIEAEAVAAQISSIGKNLQEHDLYLKWQWIKMMEDRPNNSTIYVATESSLPILEATRRIAIHQPKDEDDDK